MEAVRDAMTQGTLTLICSRSQRQSVEVVRRARQLARAASVGASSAMRIVVDNQDTLEFSGGGRIMAVPGNPDTVAGFSGNVVLDEFARHHDPKAIWEAVYPTISADASRRISVVSTPMGRAGMFYSLIQDAERASSPWSLHRCDIHQANMGGCCHDVDALRRGCLDEQTFRQSYLCEFVDEQYALLDYATITACVDGSLTYAMPKSFPPGDIYVGIDVGRARNLTVITALRRVGRMFFFAGAEELRGEPFGAQREAIGRIIRRNGVVAACIDATGLGMQLAEELVMMHGRWKVRPVTITAGVKSVMAGMMQSVFSDRRIAIPDDETLHADLHSVARMTTPSGNVRFAAAEEGGSHADRFSSIALALYTGLEYETGPEAVETFPVSQGRRFRW